MKTIFIVDDEPDITIYLTKILEQQGYNVTNASSADMAAKILATQIPDLVCLDIMMPQESGISLYQQMREDQNLQNVPVIIISGVVREGEFDIRNFVTESPIPQPEGYLEKPIRIDEFLRLVDDLIAGNRSNNGPGGGSHA